MDIQEIKNTIPHRYPFLLVDKVTDMEEGKHITAIKNVTANEPFFQGHFPNYPVMPGVLIVEALAQAGAIAVLGIKENQGKIGFLAGLDKCRFKHQVKPGDQLELNVEITRIKGSIGKGKGTATVNGKVACEAEITFAIQ
ncbi:3-hydroxyacyl-ACP dehydratase FabZ [Virgibacillus siamensis]|uniref:3-hydroxyacyl-[acyl-carrier-protein] dehydratase FabZ n=1 Tax=Virgibacillus siamensis TaxID=480071 RepID=A0ABN1G6V9_9BACI